MFTSHRTAIRTVAATLYVPQEIQCHLFDLKITSLYVKGSAAVQKLQVLFCVFIVISTEFWAKYEVTLVSKAIAAEGKTGWPTDPSPP